MTPSSDENDTTESDQSDGTTAARTGDQSGGRGRRDVVVPLRVYKTVTVFSTLIAIVSVVLGFVLLDAATLGVSALRTFVDGALRALGVPVADPVVSALFAIVGLVVIGFGAWVYVLGTRFRAGEMGKSQEDSPEDSTNG